jgi:type II secretory pathway pseudopilin PulG
VVIAIIGLLSTLAVVALNSAREKARDAKRVADIKQIQTALELYFNDAQGYPTQASIVLGVATNDILCWGLGAVVPVSAGFLASSGACMSDGNTYMGLVPSNPSPVATATGVYTYTSTDSSTYSITFALEGGTGSLPGETILTATPDGITQ